MTPIHLTVPVVDTVAPLVIEYREARTQAIEALHRAERERSEVREAEANHWASDDQEEAPRP